MSDRQFAWVAAILVLLLILAPYGAHQYLTRRTFSTGIQGLTGACTPGELYLRTDAPAGEGLYLCVASARWKVVPKFPAGKGEPGQ